MPITMNVKLPISKDRIPVEMADEDTFRTFRKKIVALEGMQGVTEHRIVLCPDMWNYNNIDVFLKWGFPGSRGNSSVSGKCTVVFMPMHYEEHKILMEFNPVESVLKVLSLQKEHWRHLYSHLVPRPRNADCYFLYKQQVMNPLRSFEWHGVRDGDTIMMFIGFINNFVPYLFDFQEPGNP